MKKAFLWLCAMVISIATMAQISKSQYFLGSAAAQNTFNNDVNNPAKRGWGTRQSMRSQQVVYTSDFANPADWIVYHDPSATNKDWAIGNLIPGGGFPLAPIASPTSSNGYAMFDPECFDIATADPDGYSAYIQIANSIDCSSLPSASLTFYQYHRRFGNQTFVDVSTDSVNWTVFEVNAVLDTNEITSNPEEVQLDISSVAAGEAEVWIRFHYFDILGCGYQWMIDDVSVQEKAIHDMAFSQYYFNGIADSTFSNFYTSIPEIHVNADTILFGGSVENVGDSAQSNVTLNVEVSNQGSYSGTSLSISSLLAGAMDSTDVLTGYTPNSGLGVYDVDFYFTADSLDEFNGNDTSRFTFEVTGGTYARDIGMANFGTWYNADFNIWEVALYYEINVPDTAISISAYFLDLNNGYGIDEGDPLSFYLYESNDMDNPVGGNEFYTVQASDENSIVTLPIQDENGNPPALSPGGYYASIKVYSPETAIGSNTAINKNTPPFITLGNVDEEGWFYTTDYTPFIRLNVKGGRDLCDGVSVTGNGNVIDNQTTGEIDFTPSGGTPSYTFFWSASNGGSVPPGQATNEDLTGISSQGTYTVVVSDINGCSSDPIDFTVGGIVSTQEFSFAGSVNVFPNPSDGLFTLDFKGLHAEDYLISLRNILGQTLEQQHVNLNGSGQKVIDLSTFESGIYFLDLQSKNGELQTFKLIKK